MAKKIKAKQTEGLVDIATDQYIGGDKTFSKAITLTDYGGSPLSDSTQLKLTLRKLPPIAGGTTGLYVTHNNKSFMLDLQDLEQMNFNQSILKVVPLNGTTQNITELGWKRIYPFNSAVTLASGAIYSINIETNINGWNFNESVHLKSYGNWDITWFAGSVYRSLKSEYSWDGSVLKALELGVTSSGIFLRGGNKGRTITIPANASLIFW